MPDLKGSPPLTRGIPFFGMYVCVHVGFTPAHAGNTASSEIASTKPRVHPRSRGEYGYATYEQYKAAGSPPLTRGIQAFSQSLVNTPGFTPAHAGNTPYQTVTILPAWVHPRSRGEYSKIWKIFASRISFSTG